MNSFTPMSLTMRVREALEAPSQCDMDNLARSMFASGSSMNSPALFAALSESSRSPEPLLTIDGNEALKIALLNSTCTANNRHAKKG